MKRFAWFLMLSGVLLAVPAVGEDEATPRIFPYDTHVETLDNGLKTILVPMSSEGLVSFWTVVRTGSRDEYEPGRTGFAHFFEHMMFQGTEKFPQAVYNDTVTKMGADANAYTTDDLTAYHMGIAAEDLEQALELESDRFQRLAYPKPDFETEAGAVYGEYRKNRTSPFFTIYEAIRQASFDRHTYGHTTMGYERDIKAMPGMYDYSLSFFSRYYRPDNVVIFIAGDIDVESTMTLIRRYYGEWEPGYVAPEIPAEPVQTQERKISVAYDGQSLPILWVSYKAGRFQPSDKLYAAASLLPELAFGETSEIHKKLVLEQQVVEFVAAGLEMNRDPGLLDIYTRIKDPDKVDAVLKEIDAVIARYREELPDAQRLADLKSRLKYDFLMNLDTPDRVASAMARPIAVTGGITAVDELYATYDTVTPEDIRAAAREYFVTARRTIATLRGRN